jgi:hypothetical protein
MKKISILIPIILLMVSKGRAQKKDSVTLVIDYFDYKTGDKYGFAKKFDHTPNHNDSISFKKESGIAFHKMIDSIRTEQAIKHKSNRKKDIKSNP